MTKDIKNIAVFYHKDCPDGFGAAWVAWKKFGSKAEYIPVRPGFLPKQKFENKEIYILDMAFTEETIRQLTKNNKRVVILDHHITNKDVVKYATEHVWQNNHSAAVISWQYFNKAKKVSKLLQYIEDVDLWKFKMPSVKPVSAHIHNHPFDFKVWDKMSLELETKKGFKNYIEKGNIILEYQEKLLFALLKKADVVKFGKHKTLAINSSLKNLSSELGHQLAQKLPPIGIVWHISDGDIQVSLRGNGSADVAKLAEKYGGGGHKNAAGFSVPIKKGFPWRWIKQNKESRSMNNA